MRRHGWYPVDDAGRALRWRLKYVTRELERGQEIGPDLALALLTIVVYPNADFREESLAAVRDREKAAA